MEAKIKPVHIVLTTIFVPHVINSLYENVSRHGHLDEVKIWVVGDRKTPPEATLVAADANRKGLVTEYLDIPAQDEWGRRVFDFYSRIPYDNETRRNIGYLRAFEAGCEVLISIDDDNFPTTDDFIGGHRETGRAVRCDIISELCGFHNVCEYLEIDPPRAIFPRGYPFKLRGNSNLPQRQSVPAGGRVGVTAGLWLQEPDVDATTWLNGKVTAKAFKGPVATVLAQDTWTPINTQNTSVVRELIPAFLCVPMGHDVPGGSIQRYGDIWGGYFMQSIMRDTPYHVAFGRPLVEHRRNPHDYVDDLRNEYWGMILTDWLVECLKSDFRPRASSVVERMRELSEFMLDRAMPRLPLWTPGPVSEFFRQTSVTINAWAAACSRLSP